jgi:hypothetical protein
MDLSQVQAMGADEGAKVWAALGNPETWQAIILICQITGHPEGAALAGTLGVAFKALAPLLGRHPGVATTVVTQVVPSVG